jgi:tetratricopeptide (TPR) repeat protein
LGDTQIELGEYTGAVDSFQKMIDMRPDYNSYIRIGYIRELYGDIPGAISSLQLAIDAGSKHPENIAFAYVEL